MVLMISYDLNNRERPSAYAAVADLIKRKAISVKRPLFSRWFVETRESPREWSNAIGTVAYDDDRWFVCRVQPPYQCWLDKDVWDWLNARV